MRQIKYILWIAFAGILAGCTQSSNEVSDSPEPVSLEGSWKIVAQIDHDSGQTDWEDFGSGLIYQKHLTPTHFTWFSYNPEDDVLEGAGGGSYTLEGNTYTEHIEFFHPADAGYVGQSIVFTAEVDGDTWIHRGMGELVEFDPETATMIVFDTTHIEEKWVKLDGRDNSEHREMLKTWNLVNYKTDPDGTYDSYPEFVGYQKLLTPTHFVWIRYNNADNGGEVTGLGSGSWSFDGSKYIEYISIQHPPASGIAGTTATFEYRTDEEGKWYHYGFVNQEDADSLMIDEIWISE